MHAEKIKQITNLHKKLIFNGDSSKIVAISDIKKIKKLSANSGNLRFFIMITLLPKIFNIKLEKNKKV